MSKSVIVVVAHPDDEILGCGGTAARHAMDGDEVNVLIVAEGATSRTARRDTKKSAGELSELAEASKRAAQRIGSHPPIMLGLPDNQLDSLPLLSVVKEVETVFEKVRPQIVYTHHSHDLNIDHWIVHKAALTAARPLPGSRIEAIYTFETMSSTEWSGPAAGSAFLPSRFVNIASTMDKKIAALKEYDVEMRPFPHARSIEAVEALASYRGATSGMERAEAFAVIRELVR